MSRASALTGFHGAQTMRLMLQRVSIDSASGALRSEYEGIDLPPPLGGDAAVDATIAAMSAIARDAARRFSARLLGWEDDIFRWDGAPKPQAPGPRVYDALGAVLYKADEPGQELLRHPVTMIAAARAEGDCDDRAMLGAALLLAFGAPACFIVMGRSASGPFEHVCCGVYARHWPGAHTQSFASVGPEPMRGAMLRESGVFTIDPQTKTPFGELPPGVRRVRVYPV